MVWLPSPGLIGKAGARLCAVAKAIGRKAISGKLCKKYLPIALLDAINILHLFKPHLTG